MTHAIATRSLADLAEKIRDIDFAMLSTHTRGGAIGARPMSNNRDIDYDGDSYYFAFDDALMVDDILHDPKVGLSFQGTSGMLGMKPFFVAVEGTAGLIRDQAAFRDHWTKDIGRWAKDGIDTAGLVLIKIHADRVHYWDGGDEGEIRL
jgi:general stress protein 26